jgi:ribosomal protein S18 acetylase RimI-like enzyme
MNVSLRPYVPDDQAFLFQLYAGTRLHEVAAFGWSPAQQEAFFRMQFNAQQRWYQMSYPEADHQIILNEEQQPIGRMLVSRGQDAFMLVDIALLPEYRGHGIGMELLQKLIAQARAAGKPVRLQVMRTNPAMHLYERLGFTKTGEDQMYVQMVFSHPESPP